jgi:hypothetical protein
MLGHPRVALLSFLGLLAGCGQTRDAQPDTATTSGAAGQAGGSASNTGSTASGTGATSSAGVGSTSPTGSSGSGGASDFGGTTGDDGAAGASGGADSAPAPEAIDAQAILNTYRSFAPQTPAPVNVSGYIFGLCRLPTLPEEAFAASIHGDGRYLQDWANPSAAQGIATRGAPAFPAGSVIVKEKYAGPDPTTAELVALGIMIKRQAGFDPAQGDWDYAYYEPALGVLQTTEQSAYCGNCHSAAAETDFVFIDGLRP